MANKFYLTTSIAYTNAEPHIGFAQEVLAADVLARHWRQKGAQVFYLTGTDENGIKIYQKAQEEKKAPQQFVDEISAQFQNLKPLLNLSWDNFIRTSDQKNHWPKAQEIWQKLVASGDICKKKYAGWYCAGCETFLNKEELKNGKCPIHQKKAEKIEEENYFFRLSKYGEKIKKIIASDKLEIRPKSRKNEALAFIERGLEDISFSRLREKLPWGIPVPGDEAQTIYVWCDALTNYLSGAPAEFWPADIHIIGKDILRFHAIIWPAMLLSTGLALPKKIYVHGFISVEGKKMSKSLANVISPDELVKKFGVDGARYILLKLWSLSEDTDFSRPKAQAVYNSDLANELGNLVLRSLTLASRISNFESRTSNLRGSRMVSSEVNKRTRLSSHLVIRASAIHKAIKELNFQSALGLIWKEIKNANKKIDQLKLWDLVKSEPVKAKEELAELLGLLWQTAENLAPFLPETSEKIKKQIQELKPGPPLFPKK